MRALPPGYRSYYADFEEYCWRSCNDNTNRVEQMRGATRVSCRTPPIAGTRLKPDSGGDAGWESKGARRQSHRRGVACRSPTARTSLNASLGREQIAGRCSRKSGRGSGFSARRLEYLSLSRAAAAALAAVNRRPDRGSGLVGVLCINSTSRPSGCTSDRRRALRLRVYKNTFDRRQTRRGPASSIRTGSSIGGGPVSTWPHRCGPTMNCNKDSITGAYLSGRGKH